ncbi:MAG: transcriptional repressor [Phycisphaeraceae bacterium]|nr:MAG: transcriptional repressor [Phycisphaeraceae bacterium]
MVRQTKQRSAIRSAILAAAGPLSAQEILHLAKRKVQGLGLATVYRSVKSMVDQGELVPVEVPGEPPRYEAAGKEHHHHFLCRSCSRLFDLQGCAGDFRSLLPAGFTLESHELTLVGVCAPCGKRRRA